MKSQHVMRSQEWEKSGSGTWIGANQWWHLTPPFQSLKAQLSPFDGFHAFL